MDFTDIAVLTFFPFSVPSVPSVPDFINFEFFASFAPEMSLFGDRRIAVEFRRILLLFFNQLLIKIQKDNVRVKKKSLEKI
jgi:hypothetical protein